MNIVDMPIKLSERRAWMKRRWRLRHGGASEPKSQRLKQVYIMPVM